jgi:hypothetical protein
MSRDQSQSMFQQELASTEKWSPRRAREKRKNRSFFKGGGAQAKSRKNDPKSMPKTTPPRTEMHPFRLCVVESGGITPISRSCRG